MPRDPRWMLSVRTDPTRLKIGRDRLRLSITSDRPGFVYVIALGTDGKQLAMLFPNAVDRNNQIAAGKPIDLPRPGWAIAAGGPAGTNRFVAIVSDAPRDWTQSGLGKQSPFAEFDFKQLQASHGANGASALSGSVQCKPDTPNCGRFGAETFQVEESE